MHVSLKNLFPLMPFELTLAFLQAFGLLQALALELLNLALLLRTSLLLAEHKVNRIVKFARKLLLPYL